MTPAQLRRLAGEAARVWCDEFPAADPSEILDGDWLAAAFEIDTANETTPTDAYERIYAPAAFAAARALNTTVDALVAELVITEVSL